VLLSQLCPSSLIARLAMTGEYKLAHKEYPCMSHDDEPRHDGVKRYAKVYDDARASNRVGVGTGPKYAGRGRHRRSRDRGRPRGWGINHGAARRRLPADGSNSLRFF